MGAGLCTAQTLSRTPAVIAKPHLLNTLLQINRKTLSGVDCFCEIDNLAHPIHQL